MHLQHLQKRSSVEISLLFFGFLLFIPSCNAINKFCPGLNATRIKNGHIYPANCTAKSVPLGTKCYVVCNKGYGYRDSAYIETECSLKDRNTADWTADDYIYLYGSGCHLLAICPPLDSAQSSSWFGCANTKSLPGYTCSFSCRSGYPIGTIKKVCHSNGTWTPLSGAYCGNVLPPFTITCPGRLNLNTLPAKATADAQGKFANPISDYPESEFKMQLIGAPSIDSLPTSNRKDIRFTITNAQHGRQSSCEFLWLLPR